jgi:hypothetical protein
LLLNEEFSDMAVLTSHISKEEYVIAGPGEPIVNVTAVIARRKASGYVGGEISHLMIGDEPSLVLTSGRVVWRVPILLTSPRKGNIGVVGHLDIDARSGQLLISQQFKEEIESRATALVTSSPL